MPIATKLNVLFMTTGDFSNLSHEKKVVFRLFLNADGKLTLGYLQAGDTDYDNGPLRILDVSGSSKFSWKKGMYFGDQKIGKDTIKEIQDKIIATPSKFVVFTPNSDPELTDQIAFTLNLSDVNHADGPFNVLNAGVTNPSPPRNSGRGG